jgi:hypothetical protein
MWGFLLYTGGVSLALLYLVFRLYTKRDVPWSGSKSAMLWLCAVGLGMTMICWPAFEDIVIKSAAGGTKTRLVQMRSMLAGYLGSRGAVPADLSEVVPEVPAIILPLLPHPRSSEVRISTFVDIQDSGRWLYVHDSSAPVILIDCTHEQRSGHAWSSY